MQNFCMLFNDGRPKLTDSSYDAEFLHFKVARGYFLGTEVLFSNRVLGM